MAVAGATPAEMRAYLLAGGLTISTVYEYFDVAFLQSKGWFRYTMPTADAAEGLKAQLIALINEHRAKWEYQHFPELMRLRDYHAFSRFAVEHGLLVLVCSANHHAGQHLGRPNVACYDGSTFVFSRYTPPHEGLLAADPADARLHAALQAFPKPWSYEHYASQLGQQGLRICGPEEGYVLETLDGRRVHEGYRLHGIYDKKGETAWQAGEGERLRGTLNRYLGMELVRHGPHDDWEHRNSQAIAGPLYGPQLPIVVFQSDGRIENFLTITDFASDWHYGRKWMTRYPALAAAES